MKLHRTAIALGVFAVATSATSVSAQDSSSPLYGGVSMGQARATIDDERISNSLLGSGYASSISDREHSFGYKIFGGYQVNRNFALEAGYFSLGKFGYNATTTPAGTLTGDAKVRGINLDMVGTLPVTDKLSAIGRVGLTYVDTRDKFSSTGLVVLNNANPSERSANWKAGIGVEYAFTPALSMRAEIERYRIKDAVGHRGDVDMATIGVVYRFGAGNASVARTAQIAPEAAPVYVAPIAAVAAPPVAPAPVLQPAVLPSSKKVTFAAATFFDFDKSVLKPDGKAKLDELFTSQQVVNLEVTVVAGHTDAVGTDAYNDRLSLRRAEAVKGYLVAKGLDAKRVYAEGKGERQPVADNHTSEGRAQNRRVQIELVGTTNM